jgi:uncharacterized protein YcaQ
LAKRQKITQSDARRLMIQAQGLDGRRASLGEEGAEGIIARIGHVQIDTISVVQRAHHHIFWARDHGYRPEALDNLLKSRRAYEYWRHAACYLPMQDYRFSLPRMKRSRDASRSKGWLSDEQNRATAEGVLERIREEGPLGSADFDAPDGKKRGTWWDWKPAKVALETLFTNGDLMVAERRKFQRLYDLAERVLPADADVRDPSDEEILRFETDRALRTLGLLRPEDMPRGIQVEKTRALLEEKTGFGEVVPLEIEGWEGETHYALAEGLNGLGNSTEEETFILSPFDNLVLNRGRLKRFFDFEYRLECYVPAEKRRHGYFSLPILHGDRFVGRLDAKAERKARTLILRRLTFEPGCDDERLLPGLAKALHAFVTFNDCERFRIETVEPESLQAPLAAALKEKLA